MSMRTLLCILKADADTRSSETGYESAGELAVVLQRAISTRDPLPDTSTTLPLKCRYTEACATAQQTLVMKTVIEARPAHQLPLSNAAVPCSVSGNRKAFWHGVAAQSHSEFAQNLGGLTQSTVERDASPQVLLPCVASVYPHNHLDGCHVVLDNTTPTIAVQQACARPSVTVHVHKGLPSQP